MKFVFTTIASFACAGIWFWLLGAFIVLELDPTRWSEASRAIYAALTCGVGVLAAAIAAD